MHSSIQYTFLISFIIISSGSNTLIQHILLKCSSGKKNFLPTHGCTENNTLIACASTEHAKNDCFACTSSLMSFGFEDNTITTYDKHDATLAFYALQYY